MITTEGGKLDVASVQEAYRKAAERTKDWRKEARECYDYVAGEQWDEDDKQALEDQMRPAVTFNRTSVYVSVVTGLQAIQREEVQFIPRRVGPVDNGVSDLWRAALKYVAQDSDAEIHQSQSFADLVITGMGWTETRMDYLKNPDGDVVAAERIDPLEMYWDQMATHRNLADARWIMRVVPFARHEVDERWPDKADSIEWSQDFTPLGDDRAGHQPKPQDAYGGKSEWSPDPDDVVHVAHVQWWEPETYYRVAGPGGSKDVPEKTWRKFEKQYPDSGLQAVKLEKRSYKQAFVCGSTVLEEGAGLCDEDFSLQSMTGHYDRNKGTWHGLVRGLRDPQDWLNKLYSSLLHTISSNAKGGLIIEETAVSNQRQIEDDWARPDRFTWVRDGAVVKGQIMPKPTAPYPQGMDRLMEVALRMFGDVSGVNPELLGMAQQEQAGVLEYQRKQAAMTALAWAFDALRGYLKRWGKVVGYCIQHYLADGRLIRVAGEAGAQYIPLLRDQLALEYDVVVDTAPSSPNEKDRTFALISQMMPFLAKTGVMPPPEVLDYMPLPASLVESWKQSINKPNPQQQQAAQLELEGKKAEVDKMAAEAVYTMARAEGERTKPQQEQMKMFSMQQADERKAMLEAVRLKGEMESQRHEQLMMQFQATLEAMRLDAEQRKLNGDLVQQQVAAERERVKMAMEQSQQVMALHTALAEHRQAMERMAVESRQMHEQAELRRIEGEEASKQARAESEAKIAALGDEMGKVKKSRATKAEGDGKMLSAIRDSLAAITESLGNLRQDVAMLRGEVEEIKSERDEDTDIERDEIGNIVRVGKRRVERDGEGYITRVSRMQ